MATTTPPRLLFNEREAAEWIGMTPRFLAARRHRGDGPPYVRISSRCVRYNPDDLREWAEGLTVTSTSDPGSN